MSSVESRCAHCEKVGFEPVTKWGCAFCIEECDQCFTPFEEKELGGCDSCRELVGAYDETGWMY